MKCLDRLHDASPGVTEGTAPTINLQIPLGHQDDGSGNRFEEGYSQPRMEVGLINVGL